MSRKGSKKAISRRIRLPSELETVMQLYYSLGGYNVTTAKDARRVIKSVQRTYKVGLTELLLKAQASGVDDEFLKAARETIDTYFHSAIRLGVQMSGSLDFQKDQKFMKRLYAKASDAAKEELQYFEKFARDFADGKLTDKQVRARLDMYARTLDGVASHGLLLTLPDVEVHWELSPMCVHCPDCLAMAAGNPYTTKTLPFVPRDGHTQCLSNCKCRLRFVLPTAPEIAQWRQGTYVDVPATVPEALHQQLDDLFDRVNYHRSAAFLYRKDKELRNYHLRMQKEYNQQIVALQKLHPELRYKRRFSVKTLTDEIRQAEKAGMVPLPPEQVAELRYGDEIAVIGRGQFHYGNISFVEDARVAVDTIEGRTLAFNRETSIFLKGKKLWPDTVEEALSSETDHVFSIDIRNPLEGPVENVKRTRLINVLYQDVLPRLQRGQRLGDDFKVWILHGTSSSDVLMHSTDAAVPHAVDATEAVKKLLRRLGFGVDGKPLPKKTILTSKEALKRADEILSQVETQIGKQAVEFAHIADLKEGKIVQTVSQGAAAQVEFNDLQISEMAGRVLTHNHPSASAFSVDDIRMAFYGRMRMIRATSVYYDQRRKGWYKVTYTLDIPDSVYEKISESDLRDLLVGTADAYHAIFNKVYERLSDRVLQRWSVNKYRPDEAGDWLHRYTTASAWAILFSGREVYRGIGFSKRLYDLGVRFFIKRVPIKP